LTADDVLNRCAHLSQPAATASDEARAGFLQQ
jgi:hypothetical protein